MAHAGFLPPLGLSAAHLFHLVLMRFTRELVAALRQAPRSGVVILTSLGAFVRLLGGDGDCSMLNKLTRDLTLSSRIPPPHLQPRQRQLHMQLHFRREQQLRLISLGKLCHPASIWVLNQCVCDVLVLHQGQHMRDSALCSITR